MDYKDNKFGLSVKKKGQTCFLNKNNAELLKFSFFSILFIE